VVNLAGIEDILVFVIGLGLLAAEVMYPGHVLPGVLGVLLILAALFMGLVDFGRIDFSVQWEAGYVANALASVFGSVLLTAFGAYGVAKLMPHSAYGRRLLLATSMEGRATDNLAVVTEEGTLVGARAVVTHDLRPSGKVRIGTRRHDAKSSHGFIAKGAAVVVVRREGFDLIVAPADDEASEDITGGEAT
jgi:membrane-bound serine protease (ClpP class)